MSKFNLVLLILILLTLGPAAAAQNAGDAAEADRLNAEVLKLYREGKYDEALPVAKRVVELREKALGGEDLKVAYALANLGNVYARRGNYKEAEPLFTRALAVAEKRGVAETDFAADLDTQLGLMRVNDGKLKEGEPYLQRALDIKERAHGKESPSLVTTLLNLADVNLLRREREPAYAFLVRAFTILEQQPLKADVQTAERLNKYYCPLMSPDAGDTKELQGQLGKVIWKLEKPDEYAEFLKSERERKEREARGETVAEGGGVLNGKAITKPQPSYPLGAKTQGVSGMVVVQILVDESGKVVKAKALCGHPILAKAAEDAARAARFTPTLLSGMPVKVSGVITYNFVLQ
ncbi:MAG: TonB family protein [Acidobacteria bacterium]|nr:TonB family protein [Acidobacteriota bacterium]